MASDAPMQRILLHVEASESGVTAARYAIALAKTCGSQLDALYVMNVKILEQLLHAKVFLAEEGLDMQRDLEEDGRRYLQFVERLAVAKGQPITTDLRKGIVHTEVISKAEETKASLIVLSEFEEPLSRRDSFYDESEMILWTAKCPVLIVKGETVAEQLYDAL